MIYRLLLLSLVFNVCASPATAVRSLNNCETGYIEWEDQLLSEIVEKSHTIYQGTVFAFVPDSSREGFDGYYLVASTGTELKGGAQRDRRIYGAAPYSYPPQVYFYVDQRHEEIDKNAVSGGLTGYLKQDIHCPLMPRFVIGYRYLFMLGTESRMSFEPINAPHRDRWLKVVREAVELEQVLSD